jgi:putative PIN family toxin of toxin-antitoxin system
MLRVVLDTNVIVSSLLSKTGLPAKVLDAWRTGHYLLVTSPSIISEIKQVLASPRISKKYFITREDVEQLINLLEKDALIVPGQTDVNVKGTIPKDPKDEMFLACALEAEADLLVSGDRHLLDLTEYKGILIISVQEFEKRLARLEEASNSS